MCDEGHFVGYARRLYDLNEIIVQALSTCPQLFDADVAAERTAYTALGMLAIRRL
jgi:hypothetical protein